MSGSYWENIHKEKYDGQGWTEKPSIFAEEAYKHFPMDGTVLELVYVLELVRAKIRYISGQRATLLYRQTAN